MEHHLDAEPLYPKGFGQRQKKRAVGVLTGPERNTFNIPGEQIAYENNTHTGKACCRASHRTCGEHFQHS